MTPAGRIALGVSSVAAGVAAACGYYATYAVRSQWLGATAWRGRGDTRSVALTFDDGPGEDTAGVLDFLAAHRLPATFFLVGAQVRRHPDIARRIVEDGHEIGNHSYSHPVYLWCSTTETHRQLTRTQEVIEDVTGVLPVWARPPCGVRTPAFFEGTGRLGLRTVQWTAAGFDWQRRSASEIASLVLRDVVPGAIVLLHDGTAGGTGDRRQTVAALPLLLDGLRRRGLLVSRLSDLLAPASMTASYAHV
jgi:peptidoglycan/xylan/chitin deacetylase (PgdA/CDA1 family)